MRMKWSIIVSFLACLLACGHVNAINATGNVRGVTLNYLDGVDQDLPYILNHQTDPIVRAKLDNLLAGYRQAGVNWIRILIGASWFPNDYPTPTQSLLDKVNNLMAITRAGANAGQFQIEIVLVGPTASGLYTTPFPYTNDKTWLGQWISRLDYSNLGMILVGGDLSPCGWIDSVTVRCEGDAGVSPLNQNHGQWIKEVWSWAKNSYPTLNMTYEMIGVDGQHNSDGSTLLTGSTLISRLAGWANSKTPTASTLAFSLYFTLPPGSPWTAYSSQTLLYLNAYKAATSKPIWIDEYGLGKCTSASCGNLTEADQKAYYDGFLGASTCMSSDRSPKFAWVAGNDRGYPDREFGLVSLFDAFTYAPAWKSPWATVSQYYNLTQCS